MLPAVAAMVNSASFRGSAPAEHLRSFMTDMAMHQVQICQLLRLRISWLSYMVLLVIRYAAAG
jgi:hypothetical protein